MKFSHPLFCKPAALLSAIVCSCFCFPWQLHAADDTTLRVFIFAGQSNMVGSDSRVADIRRFPPFAGLEQPQEAVRFSYCIGREDKQQSEGWVPLQPVGNVVGPELSFARTVTQTITAPIAIIKIAAGGTTLGEDWNPDNPGGFRLYPLALQRIRDALARLDREGIRWRLEGFMWHQGENDMFNEQFMAQYGANLQNFMARWRKDLNAPELRFYIGELCTKTIWGMDLRPRMYAISEGQKKAVRTDQCAEYVRTSHIGVEIGGGAGLHYHYGTLGQLEHGVNYAEAYLKSIGLEQRKKRALMDWPYAAGQKVRLFVLAGHRNMEGERAFVSHLEALEGGSQLLQDDPKIAYRYSLGGGYRVSEGWEPLGQVGFYETFGPELSFGRVLRQQQGQSIAIARFTHSGSQIIDWTPEGSEAKSRNLYADFVAFVRESIAELEAAGQQVELAGIFYHVGENDMSWGPFRKGAPQRIMSLIAQSRVDLQRPDLLWFVSQQPPPDDSSVNRIDVTTELRAALSRDANSIYIPAFDLPPQQEQLVLDAKGVVYLGELLARGYLERVKGAAGL
jgi:hypothetical protein